MGNKMLTTPQLHLTNALLQRGPSAVRATAGGWETLPLKNRQPLLYSSNNDCNCCTRCQRFFRLCRLKRHTAPKRP